MQDSFLLGFEDGVRFRSTLHILYFSNRLLHIWSTTFPKPFQLPSSGANIFGGPRRKRYSHSLGTSVSSIGQDMCLHTRSGFRHILDSSADYCAQWLTGGLLKRSTRQVTTWGPKHSCLRKSCVLIIPR